MIHNMMMLKELRVPGVVIWKSSSSSLLSRSAGTSSSCDDGTTSRYCWSYCRRRNYSITASSSCSSAFSVTESNDKNHYYLHNNNNHQQRLIRYHSSTTITTTTDDNNNKSTTQSFIKEERIRRCLFSVPGSKKNMLQKAATLNDVDSIVYDLEDGVPYNEKELARQLIYETLTNIDNNSTIDHNNDKKQSEICIRINALDTPYYYDDLKTLIPCTKLQTVVIPKVESLSDLLTIHDIIKDILRNSSSSADVSQQHRDIRLLAAIESARGIINLREIAEFNQHITSLNRQDDNITILLDGLIFASEDYCANLEAIRTENGIELLYARSQLVTYAKAYQLQAIDMVHINFRNLNALSIECQNGKELGYNGKQAIHPNQIDIIQSTFIPSTKDILFAKQCIELFHGTPIDINGIVVDTPVYKWAIKIIYRAKAAGFIIES